MRKIWLLLLIMIGMLMMIQTGCWDYREIEDLSIAAGAAIDKEGDEYVVTVEIVDIQSGKESTMEPQIIEVKGESIFDAVRNAVQISGRKLYWSHAKIIIVSQDVAKEGIGKVLDFFVRDTELRNNLHIMVSKGKMAKELLETESITENIRSFEMYRTAMNHINVLKSPEVALYQLINDLSAEGKSAVLPVIGSIKNNKKERYQLSGTAVFKRDKLIGMLDGKETKILHYMTKMDKGGLLLGDEISEDNDSGITLEVFNNQSATEIKPEYINGEVVMNVTVRIESAIAENEKLEDLSSDEAITQLKHQVEAAMEKQILELVHKVQSQYGSDIFGFGSTVKAEMPKVWKEIGSSWDEIFRGLKVNVHMDVHIINKASVYKPMEIGD